MKVHLVASTTCSDWLIPDGETFDQSLMPPMGMASIAAYLKKHGVDVRQTDLNVELLHDRRKRGEKARCLPLFDAWPAELGLEPGAASSPKTKSQALAAEALGDYLFKLSGVGSPDLVAISCLYTQQSAPALLLAREIKRRTRAKVIIGGFERWKVFGPTYLRDYPFVDFFAEDEGELTMLRLCRALEDGRGLDAVPGLIYRDGGAVKVASEHPWAEIREIPAPDYSGLPLAKYRELQGGAQTLIPYQFVRGCLFKCTFCRFPLRNEFRFKPPEQVLEDLETLRAATGSSRFFFVNNLVNVSPKYAEALARALLGKGFLWADSARPARLPRKTLELMREAGCVRLVYGVESASAKAEKLFAKGFTAEEARRTLRDSRDAGIRNGVNLIVAFPQQTEADLREDLDFITELAGCIDDVYPYGFVLGDSPMLSRPADFGLRVLEADGYQYRYSDGSGLDWEGTRARRQAYLRRVFDHVNSIPEIGNAFGETGLRTLPLHLLFEHREQGLDRRESDARLRSLLAGRRKEKMLASGLSGG